MIGIHWLSMGSPDMRPVIRNFSVFFALIAWTNSWTNSRVTGNLRHTDDDHVMSLQWLHLSQNLALRWRHNGHDGVSIHQPHDCLLNRLFGCRSKKTSKLGVTACTEISLDLLFVVKINVGNSLQWRYNGLERVSNHQPQDPVNSPHKGPVTRKMFQFDGVIMWMK